MPKTSWKAVPQTWTGSCETSVTKVAASLRDDTSPQVVRMQLTTTFFRRQLTVSSKVIQGGHLEVQSSAAGVAME